MPHRRLITLVAFMFVVGAIGILVVGSFTLHALAPAPPTPGPARTLSYARYAGDPAELGTQHGRDQADTIQNAALPYVRKILTARHDAVRKQAADFRPFILPRHLAEIDAMARSAGIDPADALLLQCFLDLQPWVACSVAALPGSAFADNTPRMLRNLDFPALGIADQHNRVVLFAPAGRHRFVAVTWPGLIGVLSGINEHGLTLANNEVPREPLAPAGMPYMLLYRQVLEECKTVDEAITLLKAAKIHSVNNLTLLDAAGDRAAIELTPGNVVVRRVNPDQPLVSTNHQRGQDPLTPGKCRRYDSLCSASTKQWGKLDLAASKTMLDDVNLGHKTLQSIVFEPKTLTLHIAVGLLATKQNYTTTRPFADR